MLGAQHAGKTGFSPQRDDLGPGAVKVQVAAHGPAGVELSLPQLGPGQVNEVHAFAHHQQVLLHTKRRRGRVPQRVQAVGNMLGGAKIHLAFHAQQLELRAFRQVSGSFAFHGMRFAAPRRRWPGWGQPGAAGHGLIIGWVRRQPVDHHKLAVAAAAVKPHGAHGRAGRAPQKGHQRQDHAEQDGGFQANGDGGNAGGQRHKKVGAAQAQQLLPARCIDQGHRHQHQQRGKRGLGNQRQQRTAERHQRQQQHG